MPDIEVQRDGERSGSRRDPWLLRASLAELKGALGSRTPLRIALIIFWLGSLGTLRASECGRVPGSWVPVIAVAMAAGIYFWVRLMLRLGLLAPLLLAFRPVIAFELLGWLMLGAPTRRSVAQVALWLSTIGALATALILTPGAMSCVAD